MEDDDKSWLPSPEEVDEYMEYKGYFKVIVAGGRTMNNYELLCRKLDAILVNKVAQGIQIVSGTANGADKLGERYARDRGYGIEQFPANWDAFGKRAGYLRNSQMADYADALIAFWDGESKGTKHMIDLAESKGLKVAVVRYEGVIQ